MWYSGSIKLPGNWLPCVGGRVTNGTPVFVSLVSRPSLSSPFSSPCYVDFNCSICFANLVSRERASSLSRHALHTESCAKNDSFGHRPDAQRLLPAARAENLVHRRLTATVNIPKMTLQIVQVKGRDRPFFILFSRISDVIIFCIIGNHVIAI